MRVFYDKTKLSETKHIHPWFRKELTKRWPKVYIYKPPAGQYGKKGAHDFLFCIDGKFFSIEIKTEKGKMTPAQEHTLREVQSSGGYSGCCYGKDLTFFDRIESWLKD